MISRAERQRRTRRATTELTDSDRDWLDTGFRIARSVDE